MNSDLLANKLLCTVAQSQLLTVRPASPLVLNANGTAYHHSSGAVATSAARFTSLGPVTFTLTQASVINYALTVNGFLARPRVNITFFSRPELRVLPAYQDDMLNLRALGTQYLPAGSYSMDVSFGTCTRVCLDHVRSRARATRLVGL